MLFSCTMHCTFHCVFSLCSFHVYFYNSHWKANGVNLTILRFVKDLPSITLTYKLQRLKINNTILWVPNIISIQFQNCYFFPLRSTLKQGLLRCRQIAWKIPVKKVHFFAKVAGWVSATLPKMYSLASTIQGFLSDLLLSIKTSRYFWKVYLP